MCLKWRGELQSSIVSAVHRVRHEPWAGQKSRRKKVELEVCSSAAQLMFCLFGMLSRELPQEKTSGA